MSILRDAENFGRTAAFDRHRGVERPGIDMLLRYATLPERAAYWWGYLCALREIYSSILLLVGTLAMWLTILLIVVLGVGPF